MEEHMVDDATLLRQYAAEQAEDAFAELVRRNLPFVYSAALRRLGGDAHRAQDVAQMVFCALARDARRISRNPVLSGWLYTATRNAVIDVVRSEKRRRRREQEALAMQETTVEAAASADWSQLRPVLDSAMDRLSERDREAVLLRFFQRRPFAEIGALAGLSEEAARKRVERALDKLRDLLRPHGIASTSTALGSLLASQVISAAPASLTATVTGTALASGSTAATVALFTLTKLQIGIATVVVAGGVGFVVQQQSSSTPRADATVPQRQLVSAPAMPTRVAFPGPANASHAVDSVRTGSAKGPAGALRVPPPDPSVVARQETPPMPLGPLPDAPDLERQKTSLHRRYDPFFQARGLTAAQAERCVELMIHQAIAREDLQASVRATDTAGDTPGIERIRRNLYAPVTQELAAILGPDGYHAYNDYQRTSFYRDGFVANLLPQLTSNPLSSEQIDRLTAVIAANDRPERARRTDIGTRARIDWNAVVVQSRPLLTPEQWSSLRDYASRQSPLP